MVAVVVVGIVSVTLNSRTLARSKNWGSKAKGKQRRENYVHVFKE